MLHDVFVLFGDVLPSVPETEASRATCNMYRYLITEVNQSKFLQIELAVVINAGEPFIKATCKLEGDDALTFCYEIHTSLESSVRFTASMQE